MGLVAELLTKEFEYVLFALIGKLSLTQLSVGLTYIMNFLHIGWNLYNLGILKSKKSAVEGVHQS